jgi:hypothetical protein
MRRPAGRATLLESNEGEIMWWAIGFGAFLYVMLLLLFGLGLAQKGRWALFLIGFVFPIVWIVGYFAVGRKPEPAQG